MLTDWFVPNLTACRSDSLKENAQRAQDKTDFGFVLNRSNTLLASRGSLSFRWHLSCGFNDATQDYGVESLFAGRLVPKLAKWRMGGRSPKFHGLMPWGGKIQNRLIPSRTSSTIR